MLPRSGYRLQVRVSDPILLVTGVTDAVTVQETVVDDGTPGSGPTGHLSLDPDSPSELKSGRVLVLGVVVPTLTTVPGPCHYRSSYSHWVGSGGVWSPSRLVEAGRSPSTEVISSGFPFFLHCSHKTTDYASEGLLEVFSPPSTFLKT